MEFLTELSAFCSRNKDPMIIGGDFNTIRFAKERNKNKGVQRFSDTFNTLINFHELQEIELNGGIYTWSNNQESPLLEKLDRILATRDWENLFPNSLLTKLPREISDHNPLILSTGPQTTPKTIGFRFELSWLTNPDFIPLVKKFWEKPCRAKSPLDKIS